MPRASARAGGVGRIPSSGWSRCKLVSSAPEPLQSDSEESARRQPRAGTDTEDHKTGARLSRACSCLRRCRPVLKPVAQRHKSWEMLHLENLFVEENAIQRESKKVFTALQAESSDSGRIRRGKGEIKTRNKKSFLFFFK